jgi:hypothetical protein
MNDGRNRTVYYAGIIVALAGGLWLWFKLRENESRDAFSVEERRHLRDQSHRTESLLATESRRADVLQSQNERSIADRATLHAEIETLAAALTSFSHDSIENHERTRTVVRESVAHILAAPRSTPTAPAGTIPRAASAPRVRGVRPDSPEPRRVPQMGLFDTDKTAGDLFSDLGSLASVRNILVARGKMTPEADTLLGGLETSISDEISTQIKVPNGTPPVGLKMEDGSIVVYDTLDGKDHYSALNVVPVNEFILKFATDGGTGGGTPAPTGPTGPTDGGTPAPTGPGMPTTDGGTPAPTDGGTISPTGGGTAPGTSGGGTDTGTAGGGTDAGAPVTGTPAPGTEVPPPAQP